MIFKDSEYIKLCEFDDEGDIRFTKELIELFKGHSGFIRPFVSQLVCGWGSENATILDYFGSDENDNDKYDGSATGKIGVNLELCELDSFKDRAGFTFDAEWYVDIIKSRLVSISLPPKVIKEYVGAIKKKLGRK